MAKTSKEKVAEYRARLSSEKKREIREKDQLRKAASRQKRGSAVLKKEREKARLSMRRLREARRKEQLQSPCKQTVEESPSKTAYGSVQSLGKAVQRTKSALPTSPRKRRAVVKKLAISFGCHNESASRCMIKSNHSISEDVVEKVVSFYQRDDISRIWPGRKDFVKVTNKDGSKEKRQRRYLQYNIKECFEMFKKENQNVNIGLSKFFSLRPQFCLSLSKTPENLCLCIYHENMELIVAALRPFFPGVIPESVSNFLVCDINNLDCVLRTCSKCQDKADHLLTSCDEDILAEEVQYYQWTRETVGRTVRTRIEDATLKDVIAAFGESVPRFVFHCYIKKKQYAYFRMLTENPSESAGLLQIDFSENYSIIQRNEIQSAHWAHDQVTLYTACFWYGTPDGKTAIKTYVIVSDYLNHDKYAVAVFNDLLLDNIKSIAPKIQVLNIFSDGAGQHFKQRFTLSYASSASIPINWHFFATSHGKGAVDGIGGTIKRNVYDGVRAGRFAPVDAKSFAECATTVSEKIHISFVPAVSIHEKKEELDSFWNSIPKIPDIHKIHSVRYQQPMIVKISVISEDEGHLFSFKPSQHVNEPQVPPALNIQKDDYFVCEKWYAVNWSKLNYWFIGRAISIDKENKSVKFHFLEQKAPSINQFEDVNDIDCATFSDIFYRLTDTPFPVSSSRSKCLKVSEIDFKNIERHFHAL